MTLVIALAGQASEWAQVITAAASVAVAVLAFVVAYRQWLAQQRQLREEPAREAVDRFFSESLAESRFALFDLINECAQAARGAPGQRFEMLRHEFCVGLDTRHMPTRYEVISVRWSSRPPGSPEADAVRTEFEHHSAIICAAFDAIIKAAESSADAAAHVCRRMGRLLAWWMLYWPGAFDHSRHFVASSFLTQPDAVLGSPEGSNPGYTDQFRDTPLWTMEQWQGASENYNAIHETVFPGGLRGDREYA